MTTPTTQTVRAQQQELPATMRANVLKSQG